MSDAPFPDFIDQPPPASYTEALARLVNREYVASENWRQRQFLANEKGAHPDILEFKRVFIKRGAKLGVPLFAHGVVRDREQQAKLFAAGHSKNHGRRPYPHRAFAADVVHCFKLWDFMSPQEWLLLGHLGKEVAVQKGIDVTWGGDWRRKPTDAVGWDPAHWELANWREMYGDAPYDVFPSWEAYRVMLRQQRAIPSEGT